jgi:hypothetical protein
VFHLPGGDGTVIFAAGLWATALIFYRVFDRPNVSGDAGTVGIQWGFFIAFVAAGALAYAGQRIRASDRPEPKSRSRAADAPRSPAPDAPRSPQPDPPRSPAPDPPRSPAPDPPRSPGPAAPAPAGPGEDETEVVTLSKRPTEVVRSGPRDRAVTREDARQLTFDDPPDEPPLHPRKIPRARD